MTLNDYREQFRRNMMVMSRTANGKLDLSASATKVDSMAVGSAADAQDKAFENTERALVFLFDNRKRKFKSVKELEDLMLETARITNKGVVKEDCLFRNGEDSIKYNYARIKDLPVLWDWFMKVLYWMLSSQSFEVEEIAAFCEYGINIVGHFFSDGCGKISMLISTYVFMRFDLPCPVYTSRDEYYSVASRKKIPTTGDLRELPADPEFWNFVYYYMRLCPSKKLEFSSVIEEMDDGSYICHLVGNITGGRSLIFRQSIEGFYERHGDVRVVYDCSTLAWIDMEGISVLADVRDAGRKLTLKDLNADCMVLFRVEGFEPYLEGDDKLPKIDLSGCEKINEGANGVIYRVSDEVVAKTFKQEPDYYDLVSRRIALKNALVCGVPAPLSFGYAVYDGKIVTLMELINSRSLMQIIASGEDSDEYIARYAQFVKELHEIQDEQKLNRFTRDLLGQEILGKADRCDSVLPEEYRGRARKIIEAVDEPECLVHGDIQPHNVMISGDEMLFIDFDNFSTGKSVYDLGALYRTLLCNDNMGVTDFNSFLKIPFEQCRRIWDMFVSEYYKDEPEEVRQEKAALASLIGTVLALAKYIKKGSDPERIAWWACELEEKVRG